MSDPNVSQNNVSKCLIMVTAEDCPMCKRIEPRWRNGLKAKIETMCRVLEIKVPEKKLFWTLGAKIPQHVIDLFPREEMIQLTKWFPLFMLVPEKVLIDPDVMFVAKIFNGAIVNGETGQYPDHLLKDINEDTMIEFINDPGPFSGGRSLPVRKAAPKEAPAVPAVQPVPAPVQVNQVNQVVVTKIIPPSVFDQKNEPLLKIRDIKRRLNNGSILEPKDLDRYNY